MIISDKYKFVFVHIPKCAGTFVRNRILPYDDTNSQFTSRVDEHPKLGLIDYVHIPLHILNEYFPEEYKKIEEYNSFTVIRNPYSRFPSSVSQRIRAKKRIPLHKISRRVFKRELDEIIDYFSKNPNKSYLPPDLIHFQRQTDYIFINDDKVVKHIFTTDQIESLFAYLEGIIGKNLYGLNHSGKSDNRSVVYRNPIIQFITVTTRPLIGGILRSVLSPDKKEKIRSLIYTPRVNIFSDLFDSEYVKDFVSEYYRDDIYLYNQYSQKKVEPEELTQ